MTTATENFVLIQMLQRHPWFAAFFAFGATMSAFTIVLLLSRAPHWIRSGVLIWMRISRFNQSALGQSCLWPWSQQHVFSQPLVCRSVRPGGTTRADHSIGEHLRGFNQRSVSSRLSFINRIADRCRNDLVLDPI
jgi:hypothetical protein